MLPLRRDSLLRCIVIAAALVCSTGVTPSCAMTVAQASLNNHVATGDGDVIFAIDDGGALEPIAVRKHGTFLKPERSGGAAPENVRAEAMASIFATGRRLHVIFGGRVVATVTARIDHGAATIRVPSSLPTGPNVEALASPTLGGRNGTPRRAATPAERHAMLMLASTLTGNTPPSRLVVRQLAAIDLGRGPTLAGAIFLDDRGAAVHRYINLFVIAEHTAGTWHATLVARHSTAAMPELAITASAWSMRSISAAARSPSSPGSSDTTLIPLRSGREPAQPGRRSTKAAASRSSPAGLSGFSPRDPPKAEQIPTLFPTVAKRR